jgi:maltooligosyltrehalose trehalohydrolase
VLATGFHHGGKGVTNQNRIGKIPRSDISTKEFRIFPRTWGAEFVREGEVRFRLWAPGAKTVSLKLEDSEQEMSPADNGWFELLATGISPETRYQFVLADGTVIPDPASRAQDGGINGPSIVTDPTAYQWKYPDWQGLAWEETVLYELHIGTFTPEGTFGAAIGKLPYLAELGITAIEVMPIAQFPGERGWGYDGVLPYAPHHAYGTPDDFKAFVDAAHGFGITVFLDVVYNHFGPEGNYLPSYAKSFFDAERHTPWGSAIDFSEKPVRDFFIENTLYWLLEFNIDGLRLDAVHAIEDRTSEVHILTDLASRIRKECQGRRRHLVVEDNSNITQFLKRENGIARQFDAGWNDDFHHGLHIIATGETGGYYKDFARNPFDVFGRALAEGYVRAGDEPVKISKNKTVPAPALIPPTAYVVFVQNHDQIGNRAYGDRLNATAKPEMMDALETILLLSPGIPLLFMGEEFAETRPFQFFCDYKGEIATAFREGRLAEAISFGSLDEGANPDDLPDPNKRKTFSDSKLDWERPDTADGRRKLTLMRELIAKRKKHVVPGLKDSGELSGKIWQAENGLLAIDWQLDGFMLELRANLSEEPADMHAIRGEVIHTYPAKADVAEGRIGPMTVLFAKWT